MGNKPNAEMTSTQKDAWHKYKRFSEKHDRPPTTREFADLLGQSGPSNAHRLITLFREQGLLAPRRVTETRLMVSAKGRRTS
jgi:SOS-response transcriptional repressor LexA